MSTSILWRRLDLPGHEMCRLSTYDEEWCLSGAAVFGYANEPCRLEYRITCDSNWRTRSARVSGEIGLREIELNIEVHPSGSWQLNGADCSTVDGCVDIDLGFSPSTNLLPIRRLSLAVGEAVDVRAAWLPFPSLTFEVLPQTYRRLGETTYRYESRNGAFVRTLEVNEDGFVTHYPGVWEIEPAG